MKRIFISIVTLVFFSFCFSLPAHAAEYVLPYPSAMPGTIIYKFHLIWEAISKYWYWGNFGQFDYSLKESDKYLVEAKTLFEYNQYLLGYNALEKSDMYFSPTLLFLEKAGDEGKDISEKRSILHDAALKHIAILKKMTDQTPQDFTWTPEKNSSSNLHIHMLIQQAIQERQKYL